MDFIRKCLTKEKHLKITTIKTPNHLMYFLGLTTVPIFICLLIFFLIFKQICKVPLFLYHGRKFKGFLSSSDLYWANETQDSKSTVAFVCFVKSDKKINILERVQKRMKERVFDCPNHYYPKLRSTKHTFLGYTYLLPDNYTLDDAVKNLDTGSSEETITEKEFNKLVNDNAYKPFPKDNKGLWEVLVGQKQLDTQKENEYLYPILVKIHHLVGDGLSIIHYNAKVWADKPPDIILQKIMSNSGDVNKQNTKEEHIFSVYCRAMIRLGKMLFHILHLIYVWMGSIYWFQHIRENDSNALHGPKLSGGKILAWYNENQVELVPLIKKIKNSVGKTRFSDVIYTAVSASFTDYFKKHSGQPTPESFVIGNALVFSSKNLNNDGPTILENTTCFVFLPVPTQKSTLLNLLREISELNDELLRSPFVEVNMWSLKYLVGLFPEPLLDLLTYINGVTSMAINLPGGGKSILLDGCEAQNIFSFALNRYRTGVSLGFLTYDDRLQMTIVVDKALIKRQEAVDSILKDFIKNLYLLNEEITAEQKLKMNNEELHINLKKEESKL